MASSTGGTTGRPNPITTLADVVKFILRAAPGVTEGELTDDGTRVNKPGFVVGHNAEERVRAVFVEALGFGDREQQLLNRYKTAIGRALTVTLGVDADTHVSVLSSGMVRVSRLDNEQIERLRARYSA